MYQVVEDYNYECFKSSVQYYGSKDGYTKHKRTYIDCLGHHHKMRSFKLTDKGNKEITYKHDKEGDTYKINLRFALVDFHLDIEKKNRYYNAHISEEYDRTKCRELHKINNTVTKNNIQLIGITVGDLIKHYYHANKLKSHIMEGDNDEQICLDKQIKRALSVDTSVTDVREALGVYPLGQVIYLWDSLKFAGFISKGTNDLDGLYKKILFFSEHTIYNLFVRDKEKKEMVICNDYVKRFFEQLSNKNIINKLFRYHLYSIDPEIGNRNIVYVFDEPKSLPEILMAVYEKTQEENYLQMHREITKPLSKKQEDELVNKYIKVVVNSLEGLLETYPNYALRNVYMNKWNSGEWYSGDYHDLVHHYKSYDAMSKLQKFKHAKNKESHGHMITKMDHRYYNRNKHPKSPQSWKRGKSKYDSLQLYFDEEQDVSENYYNLADEGKDPRDEEEYDWTSGPVECTIM